MSRREPEIAANPVPVLGWLPGNPCRISAVRQLVADAPPLAPGALHVWLVRLSQWNTADDPLLLSDSEKELGSRFRAPSDRVAFRVRRTLVRYLLAAYAGVGSHAVRNVSARHGGTRFYVPRQTGRLRVSASRSGQLLAYVAARGRRVGIDIERDRPIPESSELHLRLHEGDRALNSSSSSSFLRDWTAYEATLKAAGHGVACRRAEARIRADEGWGEIILAYGRRTTRQRFQLLPLEVPGYVATVAYLAASESTPKAVSELAAAS